MKNQREKKKPFKGQNPPLSFQDYSEHSFQIFSGKENSHPVSPFVKKNLKSRVGRKKKENLFSKKRR